MIQDDRNVVLYAADGPAWSTRTETDARRRRWWRTSRWPRWPSRPTRRRLPPRTCTVVSGDTLFAIAERFYGDGNRYRRSRRPVASPTRI